LPSNFETGQGIKHGYNGAAVVVDHVTKSFRIPKEHRTTLKENFVRLFRPTRYETFDALHDVSMTINYADFYGMIGRNGSGKTTLLKILAGIYEPDEGNREVNGRVAPFLELGIGFNPELTGRENVFLNGIIMGLTRREVRRVYGKIVDFAEIERFMDMKVKNYSSGMSARLAFAVAIHVPAEIMLLDEVLAVGDVEFQEKCFDAFERFTREGRTILFVSHDLKTVQQFCTKVTLLDAGRVVAEGPAQEVIAAYTTRET